MVSTKKSLQLIGAVATMIICSSVISGTAVGVDTRTVALKNSAGQTIAFPDICRTPDPGGPVPIPYPNMVDSKKSDYGSGKKKTRAGGEIVFQHKNVRTRAGIKPVYKVIVRDKYGKALFLEQPVLIKLDDGSYCAICANKGRVTRIMRLLPNKR